MGLENIPPAVRRGTLAPLCALGRKGCRADRLSRARGDAEHETGRMRGVFAPDRYTVQRGAS